MQEERGGRPRTTVGETLCACCWPVCWPDARSRCSPCVGACRSPSCTLKPACSCRVAALGRFASAAPTSRPATSTAQKPTRRPLQAAGSTQARRCPLMAVGAADLVYSFSLSLSRWCAWLRQPGVWLQVTRGTCPRMATCSSQGASRSSSTGAGACMPCNDPAVVKCWQRALR